MTERQQPALCAGVRSTGSVDNASAPRPAARRRGGAVTRLRFRRFHRDHHGRPRSMSARRARRVISVSNIALTAGASAAALARVDSARRVTSRWRSPISSPKEVITHTHPDPRLWGNLMAASGEHLVTAHGEISRPPLGRST
jgi:hypothetical protein